jgi:hypothetical protein
MALDVKPLTVKPSMNQGNTSQHEEVASTTGSFADLRNSLNGATGSIRQNIQLVATASPFAASDVTVKADPARLKFYRDKIAITNVAQEIQSEDKKLSFGAQSKLRGLVNDLVMEAVKALKDTRDSRAFSRDLSAIEQAVSEVNGAKPASQCVPVRNKQDMTMQYKPLLSPSHQLLKDKTAPEGTDKLRPWTTRSDLEATIAAQVVAHRLLEFLKKDPTQRDALECGLAKIGDETKGFLSKLQTEYNLLTGRTLITDLRNQPFDSARQLADRLESSNESPR